MEINQMTHIILVTDSVLRILDNTFNINRYTNYVIRALLFPYGVKSIDPNSILNLIGVNHLIISRSSSLINDLITYKNFRLHQQNLIN